MNKRERLEATLSGEAVDRVAAALWRHWPGDDQRAEDLAAAHLAWQRAYDWDFIVAMPAQTFSLQDWGIEDRWRGDIDGTRAFVRRLITEPEDWTSLKVLNPTDGSLGRQLDCLRLLNQELGEEVPIVQVIYSPLAQAKFLAGDSNLIRHMRQNAGQIHHALQTITDTTVRFIQEARKLGIAGIYYDVHHANYSAMAESEYEVFGRPYDLQLLRAADELWFNILQITGGNPMFHLMADYPVSVVSWADRQSAPSLSEGIKRIKGAASGGIDRWALHDEDPTNMLSQAQDAIRQTDAKKLILTAGGPILITTPLGNLRKFRETAETLKPEKS